MRAWVAPTLVKLTACLVLWPASLVAEEEPQLTLNPTVPPVSSLDDFTVLDDRLWTAAVTRRPQLIQTAPASVEILSGEDLRDSAATNWADRLRYVAGVDVYQSRYNQYDVGLRGYNGITNQRLIINVDGREFGRAVTGEQYGHWVGFMFLSDIDRVELVKGPSSVTYGANAFGGVISLTGKPMTDDSYLAVHSLVGSHAKREIDGTVLEPFAWGPKWLQHFDLRVNAGYTESESSRTIQSGLTQTPNPRLGSTGEDDLRSSRQRIIIGMNFADDYRMELEYSGLEMHEQALISQYTGVTSAGRVEQHGFGITLESEWFTLRHWDQFSSTSWTSEYATYNPAVDFAFNQVGFDDRQRISDLDIYHTIGDHRLVFGASYTDWESTSNAWDRSATYVNPNSWREVRNYNWGIFAEDQWQIAPRWTITAGLRYDDANRVGGNVSPRAAINYVIDPNQFVRLSYSGGYRLPNLIESNVELYFFDSDPDLDAEKVQAVEMGYERTMAGGDGRFTINGSYSYANDLIGFVPLSTAQMEANWNSWLTQFLAGNRAVTPGPFFQYANVDNPFTVWGVETSMEWVSRDLIARGDVEWFANATYQYGRYRDAVHIQSEGFTAFSPLISPAGSTTMFQTDGVLDRDINAPPDWKINIGSSWTNGAWRFGAAGRYVSSRKVFNVGSTFWRTRTNLEVQRIDAYAALDLHASWKTSGKYGELVLRSGIMDVFDSGHYENYSASADDLRESGGLEWTSEVGRTWFVGMEWLW